MSKENSPITPRQSEVLELKFSGLSSSEIAQELHLSHGTVKEHIKRSYKRLRATGPIEALHAGIQNGILNPKELALKIRERIGSQAANLEMLSQREREIAMASTDVLDGESEASIGEYLGITEATIGNHLTVIHNKLGTSSRIEVAILTLAWMQSQPVENSPKFFSFS